MSSMGVVKMMQNMKIFIPDHSIVIVQVRVLLITTKKIPPRTQLTWSYRSDFTGDDLMDLDLSSQDTL